MTDPLSSSHSGAADGTGSVRQIARGEAQQLALPAHIALPEVALPFWRSILAERAPAEWTGHSLEVAALLAVSMAQLEEQQRLTRDEGWVLRGGFGTARLNPRNRAVRAAFGQMMRLRRSLCLSGPASAS